MTILPLSRDVSPPAEKAPATSGTKRSLENSPSSFNLPLCKKRKSDQTEQRVFKTFNQTMSPPSLPLREPAIGEQQNRKSVRSRLFFNEEKGPVEKKAIEKASTAFDERLSSPPRNTLPPSLAVAFSAPVSARHRAGPPPTPRRPGAILAERRALEKQAKNPLLQGIAAVERQLKESPFRAFSQTIAKTTIHVDSCLRQLGQDTPACYSEAFLVSGRGLKEQLNDRELKGQQNSAFASYKEAFLTRDRELKEPLREKESEEHLFVIKVLKSEGATSSQKNPRLKALETVTQELKQYRKLKEGPLSGSIASHYDFDIAIEAYPEKSNKELAKTLPPCRFVEFGHEPYPISKEAALLFDANTLGAKLDSQLKELFRLAWQSFLADNTFIIDLKKSNLCMQNDGSLLIIDPMYPQDPEDPDSFNLLIEELLLSFAPRDSERFKYLDPRP